MTRTRAAAAFAAGLALAGCVLLGGCAAGAASTSYYTLSPEAAPAAGAPAGTNVRTASVWQVAIPEMVDRRALVVRTAPNRVEISDLHQWAEPLRFGIARTLAADIAARLGPGWAVVAGQPLGTSPEVRVFVDVQRFEAVAGRGVAVEALWSVRPAQGERREG
ncbi:MAG TPA: PqiC family protein, partial [Burkholderiales bacterium]